MVPKDDIDPAYHHWESFICFSIMWGKLFITSNRSLGVSVMNLKNVE